MAPAQLAQGACVALLVGWLLLLRLRGDYRDACDGVPNPWSACAAALLSLLALAWLLTPQFIDNLVETAAWQQAGGRWLASVLVGARLVAAWALWRRWRRAPAVAALVAIVDLGLSGLELLHPNDRLLPAYWCACAAATLLALGLAAWHDARNPADGATKRFGTLDVAWLLGIVILAPLANPAVSHRMWANAHALAGARELQRERAVRAAALATMQERANVLAAKRIAELRKGAVAFGRLQPGDLDTLPIAVGGPTCDVRLWDTQAGESWDAPRIAFRAHIAPNEAGRWEARVGMVGRDSDATPLRYGGTHGVLGTGLDRVDPARTKLTREIPLPADGVEVDGAKVRRLEVWRLLGARDEWTESVENPGPAAHDLAAWSIPFLHIFQFEQVWPKADLEGLGRDPEIRFLIRAESATQQSRWSSAISLRADGSMEAQFSSDYVPVSLVDPSVAVRLRDVFGVNERGNTFAYANFENLGSGRFAVVVKDPRVLEAAARIQTRRPMTTLWLRVDPGEVKERAGVLERPVLAPALGPTARAGLTCDPRVPHWFVDSFRVATGAGLALPGRVK